MNMPVNPVDNEAEILFFLSPPIHPERDERVLVTSQIRLMYSVSLAKYKEILDAKIRPATPCLLCSRADTC
jgi:hypothetical protein